MQLYLYLTAGINVAQFERESFGLFGPAAELGIGWSVGNFFFLNLGATGEYSHRFKGEDGASFGLQAGVVVPVILLFRDLGLGRIH
ncbi:MAG: hypothetical protein IPK13_11670 [Deltaproteobacteria bacterium]|nr:hypothetical protein [Deltaproteobacteria bacterium]MBK8011999.1 hypothetical protein [Deltaproteobacteria bacterium]